jgi:hypothetical protein
MRVGIERRFSGWLRTTGVLYALGAGDFLARPKAAGRSLQQLGGARLEDESSGLYNSLASAYMATIAALSFRAAMDPSERRDLIPPLLVAKAVSSGALLLRYFQTRHKGYAAASALDALLLGVTAGFYANLD